MLGHFELHGLFAAGLANGRCNALNGLRRGIGHFSDGGRIPLRFVDGSLLFTFRTGDERLSFTRGDVDLLLSAAL